MADVQVRRWADIEVMPNRTARRVAAVVVFAVLTTLGAHVAVPLPGGVPVTIDTYPHFRLTAEQVAALAASTVAQIAYVSCNPDTFARDARTLADGGYALSWVRPVGQFRWSTHVELAGCFTR